MSEPAACEDGHPRRVPSLRPEVAARMAWGVTLMVILGYPLIQLFRRSLLADDGTFTVANYQALVTDPDLVEAGLNSLWIGAGTVVGSLVLGVPFALIVTRTDLPCARFFRGAVLLTFAAPSYIAALGWILLLGNQGLLNQFLMRVLSLDEAPINIFTPWGIIFVLSTFLYPLIFMPLTAAFENLDFTLEQAGSALGASRLRILRTITLPLVLPSLMGGATLVFVTAIVIYGPVAILGAPSGFQTIPMVLLNLISAPPRINAAAVMGVPILVVIAVIFVMQRWVLGRRRFSVVGGKPTPRTPARLGWLSRTMALGYASTVLLVSMILPFGVLALTSFRRAIGMPLSMDNLVLTDNYERVLSNPQIVAAFRNSLVLAATATLGAVAIAALGSWLRQRTLSRGNLLIAPAMLSPLAFPGAVLAIGLIITYAGPPWNLGGTLAILFIGYVVNSMPLAFTYIDAAMTQVGPELEEASRSIGAPWRRTWWRITLPLVRPAVVAVSLLSFVLLFRELEMSIFLYTGANPTVATVLYELSSESLFQLVGALSVLILAINITVVLVALRLINRNQQSIPV